jgi:hypothetical protein
VNADDKLLSLEMQIDSFGKGVNTISCPYCGMSTPEGSVFCCTTLMKAVQAILDRRQLEVNILDAENIKSRLVN